MSKAKVLSEQERADLSERMRALGSKGGRATMRNRGLEYYKNIGAMGGKQTAKRGPKYYAELSRKGNLKMAEIVGAGKVVIE